MPAWKNIPDLVYERSKLHQSRSILDTNTSGQRYTHTQTHTPVHLLPYTRTHGHIFTHTEMYLFLERRLVRSDYLYVGRIRVFYFLVYSLLYGCTIYTHIFIRMYICLYKYILLIITTLKIHQNPFFPYKPSVSPYTGDRHPPQGGEEQKRDLNILSGLPTPSPTEPGCGPSVQVTPPGRRAREPSGQVLSAQILMEAGKPFEKSAQMSTDSLGFLPLNSSHSGSQRKTARNAERRTGRQENQQASERGRTGAGLGKTGSEPTPLRRPCSADSETSRDHCPSSGVSPLRDVGGGWSMHCGM